MYIFHIIVVEVYHIFTRKLQILNWNFASSGQSTNDLRKRVFAKSRTVPIIAPKIHCLYLQKIELMDKEKEGICCNRS
jgi:hypothetical protein